MIFELIKNIFFDLNLNVYFFTIMYYPTTCVTPFCILVLVSVSSMINSPEFRIARRRALAKTPMRLVSSARIPAQASYEI